MKNVDLHHDKIGTIRLLCVLHKADNSFVIFSIILHKVFTVRVSTPRTLDTLRRSVMVIAWIR